MAEKTPTGRILPSLPAFALIGTGVSAVVQDDTLYLAIPIGEAARQAAAPSASGKMNLLGSTHGFTQNVPGAPGVKVSLNVGFAAK